MMPQEKPVRTRKVEKVPPAKAEGNRITWPRKG